MVKRKELDKLGNTKIESCLQTPEDKFVSDYCFGDDWERKCNPSYTFDQNTLVVPVETVRAIIAENYELRNELYERSNNQMHRLNMLFKELCGNSTSDFNRRIAYLEQGYGISSQKLYRLVYDILGRFTFENLNKREPGQSKIQKIWEIGMLPFAMIIVQSLERTFALMRGNNYKSFKEMIKDLGTLKPKPCYPSNVKYGTKGQW